MQVDEVMTAARDALTVSRVFGEPIERDGITIVPVANVMGGGGGGEGTPTEMGAQGAAGGESGEGMGARHGASGTGVGFGMRATPAGVYEIKDGQVRWIPALDVGRVALVGQLVAIVFLLVIRSIARSRTAAGTIAAAQGMGGSRGLLFGRRGA